MMTQKERIRQERHKKSRMELFADWASKYEKFHKAIAVIVDDPDARHEMWDAIDKIKQEKEDAFARDCQEVMEAIVETPIYRFRIPENPVAYRKVCIEIAMKQAVVNKNLSTSMFYYLYKLCKLLSNWIDSDGKIETKYMEKGHEDNPIGKNYVLEFIRTVNKIKLEPKTEY